VYGAYGAEQDPLEPDSKHISKTHRYERYSIPTSTRQINNSDYLETNKVNFIKTKEQWNTFITPMCVIGNRGLYVNALGQLYPCSWTSFPYESLSTDRKTIQYKDSFFNVNKDLLNLYNYNLETVLNNPIWDKFFTSLDNPDKAWVECEQKCHQSLMTNEYAVGYETN